MTPEVTRWPRYQCRRRRASPLRQRCRRWRSAREHVEVAEGLRPLIALAEQAPAFVAVLMDSFDEAMRMANDKGIDVERGLLNGAEAALRFGATMDAERVRDLDALLKSGVLAPSTLRVIGELGRALTDTAAAPPADFRDCRAAESARAAGCAACARVPRDVRRAIRPPVA